MAEVSLPSLANELICQIASGMCVRDVICLLECYHDLYEPLSWHCHRQRENSELREGPWECVRAGDVYGTEMLLSMNPDIIYIERDPDCTDPSVQYWDRSHLNKAVENGNEEIVEVLLAHLAQLKADIPSLIVSSFQYTLQSAARCGYFSIMKMLLDFESDAIRPIDYYGNLFYEALKSTRGKCCSSKQSVCSGPRNRPLTDRYATVKLLLDLGAHFMLTKYAKDRFSYSPERIILALSNCNSISNGIVKLLVERGANLSNKWVLHEFMKASNQCMFSNEETAKLLLDHGADLTARDSLGRTVLNKAKHKALIQLFIARGLSPNEMDHSGQTLLNTLATEEASETRAELMKVLLDLGANVNSRSSLGPIPLQSVLSDRSKPCEYDAHGYEFGLDEFGHPIAKPEPETPDYETHISFIHKTAKLLLSYGADVSIRDSEDQTILYKTDNERLVELVLAYGAEVNVVDSYGQTPLHSMVYGASKAMVGTVELLLNHEADVGAQNADGNTPLHLASLTSSWEIVKLLLRHGADRNSRNQNGETPMDLLARRRRHREQFSFNRDKGNRLMTFGVKPPWKVWF